MGTVIVIGRDLQGVQRVRLELAKDDVSDWWLRVLRHWLAWKYGAVEMRLLG